MQKKKIGFDKKHVVYISMRGDIKNYYEELKSELNKESYVFGVTSSSHRPSYIGSNSGGGEWDGKAV